MKTRIIVGILLSAFLVVLLVFGGYVMLSGLVLVSLAAIYEVGHVFSQKGYRPWLYAAYLFALLSPFAYYFWGITAMALLYLAAVLATMIASLASGKVGASDMLVSLAILEYPTLLLSCLTLIYFGFDRRLSLSAACLAFAAPEFADTIAYFVGTFWGRHKLCPSISPKKTVEGSIGALLSGLGFGAILIPLQTLWNGYVSAPTLLLIGFGCGIFSQIGDLIASTIKRWAEVKDFSSIFPGHGGVMDRIDSLLFCSAFVLCCFTILTKIGIY